MLKRNALAILFFLLISLPSLAQPSKLGISIPIVRTIDGATISLKPGTVTILDFFITTCLHCQRHSPHLSELARRYGSRLKVISFTADRRDRESDVRAYMRTFQVITPVAWLTNDIAMEFLPKTRDVPQMLLFDKDGNFQKRILGWDDAGARKAELEAWLATTFPPLTSPTPKRRTR